MPTSTTAAMIGYLPQAARSTIAVKPTIRGVHTICLTIPIGHIRRRLVPIFSITFTRICENCVYDPLLGFQQYALHVKLLSLRLEIRVNGGYFRSTECF